MFALTTRGTCCGAASAGTTALSWWLHYKQVRQHDAYMNVEESCTWAGRLDWATWAPVWGQGE